MYKKHLVEIKGGFANRIATIFNHLSHLDETTFIWSFTTGLLGQCNCKWEDLFEYPKLDIIYSENIPKTIPNDVIFYPWKCLEPKASWMYKYHGNLKHDELVKTFIESLIPTKEVIDQIIEIPNNTNGHTFRLNHPNSKLGRTPIILVPSNDFLTSDSSWIREINTNVLQNKYASGSPYDSPYKITAETHANLRNKSGVISAVADWLMLFKCKKIFEYGMYREGWLSHQRTSFCDAHRICGKEVINETKKYDVGTEPWENYNSIEISKLKHKITEILSRHNEKQYSFPWIPIEWV